MSDRVKTPGLAPTPPMGWNSWDCFGASVTEEEVRANAAFIAEHLAPHGYEYVVIDAAWFSPTAASSSYPPFDERVMDDYGRFLPATNRFPSAADGQGFKPLADDLHAMGLKLGLHVMRGIPRIAAHRRLPVLGAPGVTAADLADPLNICSWNADMYGIRPGAAGTQAWYDSMFALYAEWGVDFVKLDDVSYPYAAGEIELAGRAAANCGYPIVLSLSPGPAPVDSAEHLAQHAHLWRVSADFWDRWPDLHASFDLLHRWQGRARPDAWPDADMLPLGHIALRSAEFGLPTDRRTQFTADEQRTLMSLWCLARSPLMLGGHLPDTDDGTLALITNDEVLGLCQDSAGNRQVYRRDPAVVWVAYQGTDCVVGLFNLGEHELPVSVSLPELGLPVGGAYTARDLWTATESTVDGAVLGRTVAPHGVVLVRLTPA